MSYQRSAKKGLERRLNYRMICEQQLRHLEGNIKRIPLNRNHYNRRIIKLRYYPWLCLHIMFNRCGGKIVWQYSPWFCVIADTPARKRQFSKWMVNNSWESACVGLSFSTMSNCLKSFEVTTAVHETHLSWHCEASMIPKT